MQYRSTASEETADIRWWKALTPTQRAYWLCEAAGSSPADAWAEWKRRHPAEAKRLTH